MSRHVFPPKFIHNTSVGYQLGRDGQVSILYEQGLRFEHLKTLLLRESGTLNTMEENHAFWFRHKS